LSITVAEPIGGGMTDRRWFVGIDWATEEHAVCVSDDVGVVLGERTFPHSGDGLAAMCAWLVATTQASSLAAMNVAIEVPHGAVVETLLERGAAVHAINPKQLDRFRDRFTVAGAKDDRRDAHVLTDSLRTDGKSFRRLSVADPLVIELREWSRLVDDMQQERGRLANRIRQQLLRYYPQLLGLTDDVATSSCLQLWARIPTPSAAMKIRESTVAALLRRLRIRRVTASEVLTAARATPLSVSPGTTEAAVAHIRNVSIRLELLNHQLHEARGRLDELTRQIAEQQTPAEPATLRDVDILRSAPGPDRAGHLDRRGLAAARRTQLRCAPHVERCRAGHQEQRQAERPAVLGGHAKCLQPAPPRSDVSLGTGRRSTRSEEPTRLCGLAGSRPQPRPRTPHNRRSAAEHALRHAPDPYSLRRQQAAGRVTRVGEAGVHISPLFALDLFRLQKGGESPPDFRQDLSPALNVVNRSSAAVRFRRKRASARSRV
jgi:hypothetical protein